MCLSTSRHLPLVALVVLAGCTHAQKVTSVVDPQKIDAVQELAMWKQQVVTEVPSAPADCEAKYTRARAQLNGWIDGPLQVQIDQAVQALYGSVDLRKTQIPQPVTAAVADFQGCLITPEGRTTPEDVATRVVAWATEQAKGQRKASADALKAQLATYKWGEWGVARVTAPPAQ